MMKFTWLFLINEIWINTCFQTFVQLKKKTVWLFNTVYRDTVIFSETIIIPWKSHTVTTLCARTLANPNRGCLHKAFLKVQEKKVRERELNGQTWHIKIMKSWKGNQWKGTRSSKYIFIFGGTFPLYFHLFWLVFMLVCHLRCRKPRKRQRSWNEQVLSGNRVSVHAFVFPNPSHTPPVRNISLPIPKNILGHYSYSPSTGFSLSSRTFNPADYTVSAEAGEAGNETTEGAGECCLLIRNLISLIEQNLLL